jgi:hypothetical protein
MQLPGLPPLSQIQDTIRKATKFLEALFSPGGVDMKYASLQCQGQLDMSVQMNGDQIVLAFNGSRPMLTILHLITREVEKVSVTADMVTLSIQGFPDLTLRVES